MNMRLRSRLFSLIVLFGVGVLQPEIVLAIPTGISGYSGASGSVCTTCHTAGAVVPVVTLTADSGSTTVSPGSVSSYTLTMTGGPAVTAGLDVAASAGSLIDTNASGTKILNNELTHSSALAVSGGTISWTFDWQAPLAEANYALFASVLSGNGGGLSGDGTGSTSLQVRVAAPVNQVPVADISGPTTGIEGVAVTFDGAGSSDPDGSIASYDWDLGDGSSASGVSVTHSYNVGTYTVVLTVLDNEGADDSASLTITITEPTAPAAGGGGGGGCTFNPQRGFDPLLPLMLLLAGLYYALARYKHRR